MFEVTVPVDFLLTYIVVRETREKKGVFKINIVFILFQTMNTDIG